MGVLIDASVLIEYERGRVDLPARIAGREKEEFFLSAVTASELLWLAATCLARGLTMATGNVREFGRVLGLAIEDWVDAG